MALNQKPDRPDWKWRREYLMDSAARLENKAEELKREAAAYREIAAAISNLING